jgi:hypothetical protein
VRNIFQAVGDLYVWSDELNQNNIKIATREIICNKKTTPNKVNIISLERVVLIYD